MSKRESQEIKVYVADNKDPDDPGAYTLKTSFRLETLELKSGASPSVAVFSERPRDNVSPKEFKTTALPPNTETAETGDGNNGTLWVGVDIELDSLVKVEIQNPDLTDDFDPVFFGVVIDMGFDLETFSMWYVAEDYRFFLKRTPVYGRAVYNPNESPDEFYIRSGRTTFNAKGDPDRGHSGDTGASGSFDSNAFVPPRFNRDEDTPGPEQAGEFWADYWTLGHIWNYLREVYSADTPAEITHLGGISFLDWPEAIDDGSGELAFLFQDDSGNAKIPTDFAITGLSLADAIDRVVKRAGPFDWTLVPNTDSGAEYTIMVYDVTLGDSEVAFEWGQVGESVGTNGPLILGGRLIRSSRERYNRVYGTGDRHGFDVTLIDEPSGSPISAHILPGWNTAAETKYLALTAANKHKEAQDYRGVFCRWIAVDDLDWSDEFFGGDQVENTNRPALKRLFTFADSQRTNSGARTRREHLRPIVWRKFEGTWEKAPDDIKVQVLDDICGFLLSTQARDIDDPWIWNGDVDSPSIFPIRITLAVRSDERIDADVDQTPSGERAREYYYDGAKAFRLHARSRAFIPTDDGTFTGTPVLDFITGSDDAEMGGISPEFFVDDHLLLREAVQARLDARDHAMINGTLIVSALQIGGSITFPIGLQVTDLTVTGAGDRATINLNSCIRSAKINVREDRTTLNLDGR